MTLPLGSFSAFTNWGKEIDSAKNLLASYKITKL